MKTKTEAQSYQNSQDFCEEGLGVAAGGDLQQMTSDIPLDLES